MDSDQVANTQARAGWEERQEGRKQPHGTWKLGLRVPNPQGRNQHGRRSESGQGKPGNSASICIICCFTKNKGLLLKTNLTKITG